LGLQRRRPRPAGQNPRRRPRCEGETRLPRDHSHRWQRWRSSHHPNPTEDTTSTASGLAPARRDEVQEHPCGAWQRDPVPDGRGVMVMIHDLAIARGQARLDRPHVPHGLRLLAVGVDEDVALHAHDRARPPRVHRRGVAEAVMTKLLIALATTGRARRTRAAKPPVIPQGVPRGEWCRIGDTGLWSTILRALCASHSWCSSAFVSPFAVSCGPIRKPCTARDRTFLTPTPFVPAQAPRRDCASYSVVSVR
jgi:hypothetical protein